MALATLQISKKLDHAIPGLAIRLHGPEDPWALSVHCREKIDEWVPYQEENIKVLGARTVDTAILYRSQAYRIHKVEPSECGWVYRMKLWPEHEFRFRSVELSAEKWTQAHLGKQFMDDQMAGPKIPFVCDIVFGWLPSRWQVELSERFRFSPEDASRNNAFLQYLVGLVTSAICLILLIGGAYYGEAGQFIPLLLSCYSAAEGLGRWTHIKGSERACGFPFLELADRLWLRFKPKQKSPA